MAYIPKRYLVDGEYITVQQAADRMGLTYQQLYGQMRHRNCSLQVAVNLVRENLALGCRGHATRHMVNGRWLTIQQAAESIGKTRFTLWRYAHLHGMSIAEAVEAYR